MSSTEKLLEQIRGTRPSGEASPSAPQHAEPSPAWRKRLQAAVRFAKPVCIGVDIGYDDLRLVKTTLSGINRHQIIDFRRVPFDPGLNPQDLLFPRFLRNTLAGFAGSADRASLWATISSARLDARLLRVPKVARRQIANAVLYAYRKKVPYSDKQRRFDFEVLGEAPDTDTPQIEVLAYTVPREDIDAVKSAFSLAGYPLEGVSTYPFLLQNLLRTRWKILAQGQLCALYIGRNWSRIDIFKDGNLMLSRGIRAGMNSMIEEIKADPRAVAAMDQAVSPEVDFRPVSAPPASGPGIRATGPVSVLARLVPGLVISPADVPTDALAEQFDPDAVFGMIRPALDRLIRQVERTFGHYAINVEEREIDRLCVSGLICASEPVRLYIAEQLGVPLVDLNPFENESLVNQPPEQQERIAYIPAAGLASPLENRGPNFLQTYHERARRVSNQLFNCVAFGLFLLIMAAFLGYNGWQKHKLQARHQQMTLLQQDLAEYVPLLNPETVLVLAAKAKEATTGLTRYRERYTGMAVIAELSHNTPAEMLMTRMVIRLPRQPEAAEGKARQVLSISGIIQGQRLTLEPALASYLVRLKTSPLLAEPRVIDKAFELMDDREVLRFTAELEILSP